MATHIGVGFSKDPNPARAAREAALQAQLQTKQQAIAFVLAFGTPQYCSLETLNSIRQTLHHPELIGCSSSGLILEDSIENRGIGIAAFASDEMNFSVASANDIAPQHMKIAGERLAQNAVVDFGPHQRQAMLIFSDGLLSDNSALLQGAQAILGSAFPIVGAGSIDEARFEKTHQFFQDQPLTNSAVAALLGGKINIGLGCAHGWKPLGKPRFINSAKGPVIKTIDGKKAVTIYQEYFGQETDVLHEKKLSRMAILYPLGIYFEQDNEYLIRNIVELTPDGCIVCQGDVPQGSEVHLMIGNPDFCKQAAREAARLAEASLVMKKPKLILIFESLARQKLLGRGAIQEVQAIKEVLGAHVPLLGIYTYGQIAPFKSLQHIGKAHWQNESITIFTIE